MLISESRLNRLPKEQRDAALKFERAIREMARLHIKNATCTTQVDVFAEVLRMFKGVCSIKKLDRKVYNLELQSEPKEICKTRRKSQVFSTDVSESCFSNNRKEEKGTKMRKAKKKANKKRKKQISKKKFYKNQKRKCK